MSPTLVLILSLLFISRAAVIPTEKPTGCMYDGKYYEPGVIISKTVDGSCESEVTCHEGGGIMVSDSLGCFGHNHPLPPRPTTTPPPKEPEPEIPLTPAPPIWMKPMHKK